MQEIEQLAQRLAGVRHFSNIPLEEITSIITRGTLRNYPHGATIFFEGDPCAGMFVLIQGRVTLNKLGPEGQEGVLSTLEPVIMFNEVSALDGEPNPVSAIAQTDCRLWHISRDNLLHIILQYPQTGLSLLGVIAQRNRQLVNYYSDLSFLNVHARLAKLLLELSHHGTQPIDRRENPIKLMAARIITSPEAISRMLKEFSTAGLIHYTRFEVRVINPEKLDHTVQLKF